MNTAEQVIDLQQSFLAAWTDFSVTTMNGFERWMALQIDTLRAALDGSLEQTRRLGESQNPQDAMLYASVFGRPLIEASLGYGNEAMRIVQSTATALARIADQQWRGGSLRMGSIAEAITEEAQAAGTQAMSRMRDATTDAMETAGILGQQSGETAAAMTRSMRESGERVNRAMREGMEATTRAAQQGAEAATETGAAASSQIAQAVSDTLPPEPPTTPATAPGAATPANEGPHHRSGPHAGGKRTGPRPAA